MARFSLSARFYMAVAITVCTLPLAQTAQSSDVIHVMASSPYIEGHNVSNKIINECTTLGSKLASFTKSYAKKQGVKVVLDDSINTGASGKVLQLEITDALSQGNAFIGHSKYVSVKGTLWENGEKSASFQGRRSSMGGFAAGYKGSCSVLGRCVKALGKDIAAWLSSPVDGARVGE